MRAMWQSALVLVLGAALLAGCTESNPTPLADASGEGQQGGDGTLLRDGAPAADGALATDAPSEDGALLADGTPAMDAAPAKDTVVADVKPAFDAGKVCGGLAGLPCGGNQVCNITICAMDAQGVCVPLPNGCNKVYDPVCGCDNKTYGNDCLRLSAGVALDHKGVCGAVDAGPGTDAAVLCGHLQPPCSKGDVCNLLSCAKAAVGTCVAQPQGCPAIYAPVCGCDNKTYGNDCMRLVAGVALKSQGACP